MNAEEFILIPKRMYLKDRPLAEQILENPKIQQKGMQLSMLQRTEPARNEPDELVKNQLSTVKDTVFEQLSMLTEPQKKRSEYIFDEIEKSVRISIDNSGNLTIDGAPLKLTASTFLYNLQQNRKNFDIPLYTSVLEHLSLPEHVVPNTFGKQIISGDVTEAAEAVTSDVTPRRKKHAWTRLT